VKDLEAAEFTTRQAEAVARLWQRGREADVAELATKQDVALLRADLALTRAELERRIDGVEAGLGRRIDGVETALGRRADRLENRIETLGQQLTIRLGLMLAAAVSLVGGLVALF
jgi:hypothetical protein